jgi:hypothetical protein
MRLIDEAKYQEKFGDPVFGSHLRDILIGSAMLITILLILAEVIKWLK